MMALLPSPKPDPNPDEFVFKLGDYLVSDKSLGQGSYAKVRLATDKDRDQLFAIKIIKKPEADQEKHYTRIKREVECLKELRHPHIIQLDDVFQTKRFICIVTEYASGGDLYDFIRAQPENRLSEQEALRLFWQMIDAVAHCHSRHIVHRDLKPENVLLSGTDVKIADFGFSRTFDPDNQMLSTCCGSLGYAAPELLAGHKYVGQQADIWSLGVILYTMLCGSGPFGVEEGINIEAERRMMNGTIKDSTLLSPAMRTMIGSMLQPDPNDRVTIEGLLQLKERWEAERAEQEARQKLEARHRSATSSEQRRERGSSSPQEVRLSTRVSTPPKGRRHERQVSGGGTSGGNGAPVEERARDKSKGGLMSKLKRIIAPSKSRDPSPRQTTLPRRRSKSGSELERQMRSGDADDDDLGDESGGASDSSGERSRSVTL